MEIAKNWKDYEILDMANGEKLERWGEYVLIRPDPQIIWEKKQYPELWKKVDAHYHRSKNGGGSWEFLNKIKDKWEIKYENLTFNLKPMGFKHTGLFPEQAVNWDWMVKKICRGRRPRRPSSQYCKSICIYRRCNNSVCKCTVHLFAMWIVQKEWYLGQKKMLILQV